MLTVVSDTHGREGHRLTGRTLRTVRDADVVVHAGDYTTETVLDAFEHEAAVLAGVAGNNDPPSVRDRVPDERVVEYAGFRLAVVHGHEHSETALSLFGRQAGADLVVVGHSHRPSFRDEGAVPILNPGSHTQPRGHRPGHAELHAEGNVLEGAIREPDGTLVVPVTVPERQP